MRPALIALALVATTGVALAQDGQSCLASGSDETAWMACGKALVDKADTGLAQAWKDLQAVSEPATMKDLIAEQDAWTAFRQTACALYRDPDQFGPEIVATAYPACIARIVKERAEQLKAYRREIDP